MGCSSSIPTTGSVNSLPTKTARPSSPSSSHTNSHKRSDHVTSEKRGQRAQAEDLVQNFFLIWLDAKIDESNEDFRNSIKQLRGTVNTIEIFRDSDDCMHYISQFKNDEKTFLIISGALCESVIPHAHSISQIYSIYIFCRQQSKYEKWATKEWPKVKGVFTEIDSICNSVRQAARECDEDSVVITGQIEPSFMYSLLFKEIILEIEFAETKEIKDLTDYARNKYVGNEKQVKLIDEFARDYHGNVENKPIWWYTRQCFTYSMINKALGKLDVSTLMKMGIFMRDLHKNIKELHDKQANDKNTPLPNEVFRGQTMTEQDFGKKIKQGQLMSFNNFLSTTYERSVSLEFIQQKLQSDNSKIGVLFILNTNPSIKSALFARIDEISQYPEEKEILFSTHTVFRVQQIKETQESGMNIQQVNLTLTSESNDPQLAGLTHSIREELVGTTGWHRLGNLLIETGDFEKAEEVYMALLRDVSNDDKKEKSLLYYKLGIINYNTSKFMKAEQYMQSVIQIQENVLPENDPDLAKSYNIIGA
ncbi:unnamed protein product, partial [Rotaria sp. Silwood2]